MATNNAKLCDLPDEALKYLSLEFAAIAALPAARPASGWGAWQWWLTNRERERRRGNHDVGLPPVIVGLDDLHRAELCALRDVFHEMALLADLHGQDAFTVWLRQFVGRFDAELDRRDRAYAESREFWERHIAEYRAQHPHGTPGDTSRIPPWPEVGGPPDVA